MSTALGTKTVYLAEQCISKGYNYVCYDPECVSELLEKPAGQCVEMFNQLEFSHWFDDANTAINYIKENNPGDEHKILMVGSSMGGWITLSMAMKYPERIQGIVLIAPALNFMRGYYLKCYNDVTDEQKKKLDSGETIIFSSSYGDMPLSKRFAESSHEVELDISKPLKIDCSVRILHGVKDDSVPYENSLKIMKLLASQDVDVLYRKAGDHRLCNEKDLELLEETVDRMATILTKS